MNGVDKKQPIDNQIYSGHSTTEGIQNLAI